MLRNLFTNTWHPFRRNVHTPVNCSKTFLLAQDSSKYLFMSENCASLKRDNRLGVWRHGLNVSRTFHTSERRNIPPVVLLILRPLSKIGAALIGRGIRKWWRSLPPNKKRYVWEKVTAQRNKIMIGMIILSGGAVVFYVTHLEETPISKRKRFLLFNPDLYDSMSQDMFELQQLMHQKNILPLNHQSYRVVSAVTDRLLLGNRDLKQIYTKTWSITIVENDAPNAFVLPCGQIFVFTGMLKFCETPDQLACILGHEMAHAVLGHSVEILSYTHLIDAAMMVVLAIIWAILPTDLTSAVVHWLTTKVSTILLELPYNRMLETEADEVGLQLAAKACFDIRESSVFWHKMSALQDAGNDVDMEWLSTHPIHENRAQLLDRLMADAIELRKTQKCPPLPSKDPRSTLNSYREWIQSQRKKDTGIVALEIKLPVPPRELVKK